MASSLSLNRALSSRLFSRIFSSRSSARTFRAPSYSLSDSDSDCDCDWDKVDPWRPDRPSPVKFLSPKVSVYHIRDMTERVINNKTRVREMTGRLNHGTLVAKKTADGLHLRVDMPGLCKEDVNILLEPEEATEGLHEHDDEWIHHDCNCNCVCKYRLIIESIKDDESTGSKRGDRFYILEKLSFNIYKGSYKTDAVEAKMNNGVLNVFVPSKKVDAKCTCVCARNEYFQVNVE